MGKKKCIYSCMLGMLCFYTNYSIIIKKIKHSCLIFSIIKIYQTLSPTVTILLLWPYKKIPTNIFFILNKILEIFGVIKTHENQRDFSVSTLPLLTAS